MLKMTFCVPYEELKRPTLRFYKKRYLLETWILQEPRVEKWESEKIRKTD